MTCDYASTLEAADPYCLRPHEAETLLSGHPWRRFVVLGDSVASGVGDPVDGYTKLSWVDRIAAELRDAAPDFAYLNLGERELLAADVHERQLEGAIAFKGDLALVACGGNDALRRTYQADAVDDELAQIVGGLRATGCDVITVGLFDASHAPLVSDRSREFVSVRMRTLADRTAAVGARFGSLHVNLSGHPVETDSTMYSADGLHGNLRSHAICAAETIRRLGARLGHTT